MKRIVALALAAALCAACAQKKDAAGLNASEKNAGSVSAGSTKGLNLPPDHPAIGAQRDAAAAVQPMANAQPANTISGEVLETMNGGGYTYVKLRTAQGETWAAMPEVPTKVGAKLTLNAQMVMEKFESKSLNRKFDRIVFATPATAASGTAAPGSAAAKLPAGDPMAAQHASFAQGPATDVDVKVAKAQGADAKTVAEVWAGKSSLKDKSVTIRGKVVKFTPETLGLNWIHLRDGSGSADKHDNDITVTTKDAAKVGDVIEVNGTLRLDKDFGAGYTYPVIVEGAKVKK